MAAKSGGQKWRPIIKKNIFIDKSCNLFKVLSVLLSALVERVCVSLMRMLPSTVNCTVKHCKVQQCTVKHCIEQHCIEQHCTVHHCIEQHCIEKHCTVHHCTIQHFTAQHCTIHHWTVQHCPVQHCTSISTQRLVPPILRAPRDPMKLTNDTDKPGYLLSISMQWSRCC